MTKSLRKLLAAGLIAGTLLIAAPVDAEVRTYEGTDEYIMSEFETIDVAKQRAKQKAERAAQEKAGVFVESNTEVVNMMVTKDEIVTMTGGILKVVDVQYDVKPLTNANGFIIRATVKADIDSDDVSKWLNRGEGERSDMVAQNLELQKAIAAQDAQIAELKRQLAAKPQDAEKISQQFAAEDKVFQSNQQLANAGKLYFEGDLNGAIARCTQAIGLNPDNALAYSIRGAVYYRLNNLNAAIADYNKAIQLNPGDYKTFYNRGLAYVKLNDFRKAEADFGNAILLNPNDADSCYNRGVCRQRLGNVYGAQQDLNRAKALGYKF